LVGNCCFALDYGCVHPGMPLGRKHFRRSRDAPGKHAVDRRDIHLDAHLIVVDSAGTGVNTKGTKVTEEVTKREVAWILAISQLHDL
jgi:hypothetical protein